MFDLLLAVPALIALLPAMAVLALLVRWKVGSPVLFRQMRPGRDGRLFELIKFRTMTTGKDEKGKPLPDAQRLTKFGNVLRRSSLDELPELWNVVKGNMSLVGPRPLLVEYLPLYTQEQSRRHEVRPGITGWAQVNGRNAISWEEKFALDVWYVEHVGFRLDAAILGKTLGQIFRRTGINAEGHATMPNFKGSRKEASS